MNKPKVFAHRGASAYAPENTMAAFELAVKQGSEGIELDVQLTKDGQIVICHDELLNRTTNGKGLLCQYTYNELKKFDAGSWFDSKFSQERIPTLEQLLQYIKPLDLVINIEMKNSIVLYGGLEEKIISLVQKCKLEDRIIVSSFNHYSLVEFHRLAPHIETAVLYMEGLYQPWEYAKSIGAKSLHPYFRACHKDIVRQAHEAGVESRPFTVDEPDHLKQMIDANVDAIMTNVPDRLIALLQEG